MGIPAAQGVAASGLPNLGEPPASVVIAGTFTAIGPGDPFAFRGPMDLAVYASITAVAFTTTKGSSSATVSSATGLAVGNSINSVNVPPGTTVGALSGTTITLAFPPVALPATGISISGNQITLPPGSNVAALLGATVTVPSTAEQVTLPAATTVAAIVQTDIATTGSDPGRPGIVSLSTAPTQAPVDTNPRMLRFALTNNAVVTGVDAKAVFTGWSVAWSGSVQLETSWDGCKTWVVGNLGTGTQAIFTGTPINVRFGEPERFCHYRLNCVAYTSGTINWRISQTGGAAESVSVGPLISG